MSEKKENNLESIINENSYFYDQNGYIVLKSAIPNDLIDSYEKKWLEHHSKDGKITNLDGWQKSSSYLKNQQILDILCHENIFNFLNLIYPSLALHLSFTSWTSTKKSWHQDFVDPDKDKANNYVGVWVALDKIHPNSGPFQFIPGSHKWEIDFNLIYSEQNLDKPSSFFAKEIQKRQAPAYQFTGDKGDVLIWHGHLVHAGGIPADNSLLRKSLIGHYGKMMGSLVSYGAGRYYGDYTAATDLYN